MSSTNHQGGRAMLELADRREIFWDGHVVDAVGTDAVLALHQPVRQEAVLVHDRPWEGDGCNYHNLFWDEDRYRMYYLGWEMMSSDKRKHTTARIRVCYAESTDGRHWLRPDLGLHEFEGSRNNNILFDPQGFCFDNFMVMRDDHPSCPDSERYKGIAYYTDRSLWCFTSPDAVRFQPGWQLFDRQQGHYDSLNVAFWHPETGLYHCFFRSFHPAGPGAPTATVRDIRHAVSRDFRTWSEPQPLLFSDGHDFALYTNNVIPCPRLPHLLVGFPTRYVERPSWSAAFDRLCGAEKRRQRCQCHPRYGLTITDGLFMSSRNGQDWHRFPEAFLRPGPERPNNWVYGDCYPGRGLATTPGHDHSEPELSMYLPDNHWMSEPAVLYRHTVRHEGFASYHAPADTRRVLTRPLRFEGRQLAINFATSAWGAIRVRLIADDGQCLESGELFGDSINRVVDFEKGQAQDWSGKPVRLEITMRDADVFSFQFQKDQPCDGK
jgi:hypothetical protein